MVEIGKTLLSKDIFEQHFVCDVLKCKGACCIEGDSGAPLSDDEAALIEKEYSNFEEYLPESHKAEVKKQGYSLIDSDGDLVTPLVDNRQCVYSFYNKVGILKCAIEKSFFEGKSKFRKPVSCHLFPIRITEYKYFDAINYQELDICKPGVDCGTSQKIPLYLFLKEPLIAKYGTDWYREVEIAADYVLSNK